MNPSQPVDLLEKLSNAHGVSGYEDDVRSLVAEQLRPLNPEVHTDALGNLIARFPAANPVAPTLLLDAHLDEIGLVITYIEPAGFLRFTTIGGWDERVLPAHAVDVKTEDGKILRGVIGTPPPHILKPEDRNKPFQVEHLFIDIGARSANEVLALGVRVGDSAVPRYPFTRLSGDAVMGKALDNRAGCTVLISVLEQLFGVETSRKPELNVVALFSTFEEVGGRGAQAASYGINPDLALVLEGTVAADCPGVPAARNPSKQGSGPAFTLIDRTAHLPRRLVRFMEQLADEHEIPCQLKTPIFGGTNAARIHMVRSGVATAVASVPCRYIHGAHSILRLSDLEHTINFTREFVLKAQDYLANETSAAVVPTPEV